MTCPTTYAIALKATLERNCAPDPSILPAEKKDPQCNHEDTPVGTASRRGATPKKRHDKRINDAARRRGMNIGNLGPHLNTEALDWLAKNKPPEMNIAEYMAKAILPDVMAEDAE